MRQDGFIKFEREGIKGYEKKNDMNGFNGGLLTLSTVIMTFQRK